MLKNGIEEAAQKAENSGMATINFMGARGGRVTVRKQEDGTWRIVLAGSVRSAAFYNALANNATEYTFADSSHLTAVMMLNFGDYFEEHFEPSEVPDAAGTNVLGGVEGKKKDGGKRRPKPGIDEAEKTGTEAQKAVQDGDTKLATTLFEKLARTGSAPADLRETEVLVAEAEVAELGIKEKEELAKSAGEQSSDLENHPPGRYLDRAAALGLLKKNDENAKRVRDKAAEVWSRISKKK